MNYKRMFWVSTILLCLVCILSINTRIQADTDLQSTGRIVVNNPDTGQEEVIFDANDQIKLKDSITANALDIADLKNKSIEVEDALGGFSFIKNPEVVALVADGSIYKDTDGNYILASSTTGQSLLEDASVYTTTYAEGNYYSTGADSVYPFSMESGDISFHSAAKNKTITVDNKCTAVIITTYSYADGNYSCSDRSSVKVTGSGNSAKRVKKQAMCYYNKDAGQYYHNYIDVWIVDVNVGDTITSTTCTVWALF